MKDDTLFAVGGGVAILVLVFGIGIAGYSRSQTTRLEAFELGRECKKSDVPATANPYRSGSYRERWLEGWMSGED